MADDRVVEVTQQGWLSRLGGAIKGVLFGLALFLAAFPVLFLNEGRAVSTARALEEGAGQVVSVDIDMVDLEHDGKLVHATGRVETDFSFTDPVFGVGARALQFMRKVEIHQWEESAKSETRNKTGGGTETVTTYTYDKVWQEDLIDSSKFRERTGHENPKSPAYASKTWTSSYGAFGEYQLDEGQVAEIGAPERIAITTGLPASLEGKAILEGDYIYVGGAPADPQVGALRVSFYEIPEQVISIIAQQSEYDLVPFVTSNGEHLHIIRDGKHSAESMFQTAMDNNVATTWIFRALGFGMMLLGLVIALKPLSVLADVIPLFGTVVAAGAGVVSFLVAAPLTLVTVAVAWLYYRPLLGAVLLVVAGGILFLLRKRMTTEKATHDVEAKATADTE